MTTIRLLISLLISTAWALFGTPTQQFSITPISDHLAIKIQSFTPPTITKKAIDNRPTNTPNVIIDLRDNPGGNLKDAIAFGALFVTKNQLIELNSTKNTRLMVTRPQNHPFIPTNKLIILINSNTASAAEAAAAILAHHPNSIHIGTPTHGKTASTPQLKPHINL